MNMDAVYLMDSIIFCLQNNGGASRYWYEIISRLYREKNEVYSVYDKNNENNPWGNLIDQRKYKNIFLLPLKIRRYLDCLIPKKLSKKKDSIVFHSSHYRVPLNHCIANVVTVHDFTYELYKNGLPKLVHVWQKKRAIKRADVVICISEYTKKLLLDFYPEFSNKKFSVIYHGVGNEFFVTEKDSIKYNNNVIFLGSRDRYKRFDLAVESIALLPDKILKIVGGAISKDEEVYLDERLPNRWKYEGRLSDEALNNLYNTAHCFIYPSDSEGFGLPLLEAMKAGCPVVCANKSVFPEIASDAALYAEKQNAEDYAKEINKLNDLKLRSLMKNRGFQRSENFTWDKCFSETLVAYQDALKIHHSK